ncbi:hypothetical protein ACJX0J_018080, partial [Zea mays]
ISMPHDKPSHVSSDLMQSETCIHICMYDYLLIDIPKQLYLIRSQKYISDTIQIQNMKSLFLFGTRGRYNMSLYSCNLLGHILNFKIRYIFSLMSIFVPLVYTILGQCFIGPSQIKISHVKSFLLMEIGLNGACQKPILLETYPWSVSFMTNKYSFDVPLVYYDVACLATMENIGKSIANIQGGWQCHAHDVNVFF